MQLDINRLLLVTDPLRRQDLISKGLRYELILVWLARISKAAVIGLSLGLLIIWWVMAIKSLPI